MRNSIASRPLRSSKSGQTESGNIWQQYDILAIPYLPNLFTIFMQNKYLSQNKLEYYIILFYCCCYFRYRKKFKELELDITVQISLGNLLGFWLTAQIMQTPAQMGTWPSVQWVLETYILLPKGDSQKLQHNSPRFLKLFLNFLNPIQPTQLIDH